MAILSGSGPTAVGLFADLAAARAAAAAIDRDDAIVCAAGAAPPDPDPPTPSREALRGAGMKLPGEGASRRKLVLLALLAAGRGSATT